MNKKVKSAAQFDTPIVKEDDDNGGMRERTVNDQKTIDWEVWTFYWKIYRKQEVEINKE